MLSFFTTFLIIITHNTRTKARFNNFFFQMKPSNTSTIEAVSVMATLYNLHTIGKKYIHFFHFYN